MRVVVFRLDDNLEREFRRTIAQVKGLHKGVIKEAMQEAIRAWIKKQKKK